MPCRCIRRSLGYVPSLPRRPPTRSSSSPLSGATTREGRLGLIPAGGLRSVGCPAVVASVTELRPSRLRVVLGYLLVVLGGAEAFAGDAPRRCARLANASVDTTHDAERFRDRRGPHVATRPS